MMIDPAPVTVAARQEIQPDDALIILFIGSN